MKNRVYKIKDKILVRGNENELTKDEVLVKEKNGSVVLKERVNGQVRNIAGGSAQVEYIDITSWSNWGIDDEAILILKMLLSVSLTCKISTNGNGSNYKPEGVYIIPNIDLLLNDLYAPKYLAICFQDFELVIDPDFEKITFLEYLERNSEPLFNLFNSLPRLTEDEYYNLTLPTE